MRKFCLCCCLVIVISVWGCQSSDTSNGTQPTSEPTINQETMNKNTEAPQAVIDAVFNDITSNNTIESENLQVTQTEANTWPDGCLGLAKPDEMCTQALVEGWRITVTDGQTTWVYRTDQTGQTVRTES
ncbi:hypothetical protein [Cyanothece sp. BG0011]|uniref:hypothetical protein n=1 Tax=Cyanothece sp. BG0011 TaxID=2082950 RepID=UPI000D1DF68B|nr:hypothetical protein [Cyanothece sp. BG0011]